MSTNGFPCSANQRLVLAMQDAGFALNVPLLLHAQGDLDLDIFADALRVVVHRHEMLRTRFVRSESDILQTPVEAVDLELAEIDLTGTAEPLGAAIAISAADARQNFELAADLRLRAKAYRLGAHDHLVAITIDHLAADGASLAIILHEIQEAYRALEGGVPFDALSPPPQYRAFASWQNVWLDLPEGQAQLGFWLGHLAGLPKSARTADGSRPPYRVEAHHFAFDAATTRTLLALGTRTRITPFMGVLTVFAAALANARGARDFCVSTVRANRRRPFATGVVGHFANLIPIRLHMDLDRPCRALLLQVREICRAAYLREEVPFANIAAAVQAEFGLGGAQLSEFAINFIPFGTQQPSISSGASPTTICRPALASLSWSDKKRAGSADRSSTTARRSIAPGRERCRPR